MTQKKRDFILSLAIILGSFLLLVIFNMISAMIDVNTWNIFSTLKRYDSILYDVFVKEGYISPNESLIWDNGTSNYAFFPFYLVCVKILYLLFGTKLSPTCVGSIFSTILMIFFIYNLVQYLRWKDVKVNWFIITCLFVFNFTYIFYFSFYTEAMSLFLLILFIRFCDRDKFVKSSIVGVFLTATRVNNIFFILYLLYSIMRYNWRRIEEKNKFKRFCYSFFMIFKQLDQLTSLLLFPLGMALYMIYLNVFMHLPVLAFADIQVGWKKETNFFIITWWNALIHDRSHLITCLFVVWLFIFTIILLHKKKYIQPLIIMGLVLYTLSSSINSIERYVFGMLLYSLELYFIIMDTNVKEKHKHFSYWFSLVSLFVFVIGGIACAMLAIIFDKTLFY